MLLRPRQQVFVDRIRSALDDHGNTLGVAPTGAGKTVMLSAAIEPAERTLVLQHRDELLSQNRKTFHRFHGDVTSGAVDAQEKQFDRPTIFAMVQTLMRDASLIRLPVVSLLAIDEAHHAAAGSWRKIEEACRERNPKLRVLGVTATPTRPDGKSLRCTFSNVADQITIGELIKSGHLVRPRTFVVDIGTQEALRGVRRTASDFDMAEVERIMDKRVLNDEVVTHWMEKAAGRPTIAFASTVAHAEHVAAAFNGRGVKAAIIHGDMADGDRASVLAAFRAGTVGVLVNVAVLTEGYDAPIIACVLLLRPSSSKSTMIQMIGRGLRTLDPEIYPGRIKTDCVVLDFGTSTLMHGSLEQDAYLVDDRPKGEARLKECPGCGGPIPASSSECPLCGYVFPSPPANEDEPETLRDFKMVEVDLLDCSPFRWEDIFDDDSILVASAFDAWAVAIWYFGAWHAVGGMKNEGIRHLGIGERVVALAAADEYLSERGDKASAAKSRSWLNLPATDKQMSLLGVNPLNAFSLNRYRATCQLSWMLNQRGIRARLESTPQMERAA